MNNWMKRVVSFAFIIAQFLVIPAVSASSLENIQSEKETLETEVNQAQKEINNKLSEASKISSNLEKLNQEISEHEEEIVQTEEDIQEQEILVEKRYEHTAEQLKAMQKSEVNQNVILNIFQAESMTEFFNALYTASILTGANEDHLVEAQKEAEKLNDLQEELVVYQEELDEKKAQTVEQKEALDNKLADLKTTLAANQEELKELNAEEAKIKKAAEQEKESVAVASSEKKSEETKDSNQSSSKSESKSENKSETKSENKTESNSGNKTNSSGSWMSYQSTGYSLEEPGLTNHTATGIDLRQNPRVIAVDPSQIPLGSLVEIEGMGIYVAGDTGSAINGRIIDIHFSSVSDALSWGRRNVNIRIVD